MPRSADEDGGGSYGVPLGRRYPRQGTPVLFKNTGRRAAPLPVATAQDGLTQLGDFPQRWAAAFQRESAASRSTCRTKLRRPWHPSRVQPKGPASPRRTLIVTQMMTEQLQAWLSCDSKQDASLGVLRRMQLQLRQH